MNDGKILKISGGVAGLLLVGGQFVPILNNAHKNVDVPVVSIQSEDKTNLVVKAFNFTGIPELRISGISSTSSIIAGVNFSFIPTIVDVG